MPQEITLLYVCFLYVFVIQLGSSDVVSHSDATNCWALDVSLSRPGPDPTLINRMVRPETTVEFLY